MSVGCTEDPWAIDPPADCSRASQDAFALEVMQRFYLFNNELDPEVDPENYADVGDYVRALRVSPDRWSRVRDLEATDALYEDGQYVGYGFKTVRDGEGRVRVARVDAGSSAHAAGLERGHELVVVGGYAVDYIDEEDLWDDLWGPKEIGVTQHVEFVDSEGQVHDATLEKDWVQIVTLPHADVIDTPDGEVGYVVFDKFLEPSEAELYATFDQLEKAGVDKMIVDLRYNSGGRISIAKLFGELLIGKDHDDAIAYRVKYNSDFSSENVNRYFTKHSDSLGMDDIVFITSGTTLSSSELLINMMRPYANVRTIGATTGGKPVGSRGYDFCEQSLTPIMFRMANADNQTDYFDGFTPECFASDDLERMLGDPEEAMLATALELLDGGSCPEGAAPGSAPRAAAPQPIAPGGEIGEDDYGSW